MALLGLALAAPPRLPSGAIGGRAGVTMAAADFFEFSVVGSGAHGAMPHLGVDPVTATAAVPGPWLLGAYGYNHGYKPYNWVADPASNLDICCVFWISFLGSQYRREK